ncbi:MAG: hypothetical protein ACPGOV_06050 [Magnetovibrionaceae bacterium]
MRAQLFFLCLVGLLISLPPLDARAEGRLVIENKTEHKLRIAGPGGKGRMDSGVEPMDVFFDTKDEAIEVKIWFADDPRQLCIVYTPFERKVVVSGKTIIGCLSRNP